MLQCIYKAAADELKQLLNSEEVHAAFGQQGTT